MALTESKMLPLGTKAPSFVLKDVVTGELFSTENLKKQYGLLVMFLCAHCPYVKHIEKVLSQIMKGYQDSNLGIVAISSNDSDAYPDDSPDSLKKQAENTGFTFPYLFDETQAIAKAFQAACTPEFYLFDGDLKLAYRGRFDKSTPGNNISVTGEDLVAALECLLNGKPSIEIQYPSIGCNIKWK